MNLEEAMNRIDRHLKGGSGLPLVVNTETRHDMRALLGHYNVPGNNICSAAAEPLCHKDALPAVDALLDLLAQEKDVPLFIHGLTPLLMLRGKDALTEVLRELLNARAAGPAVIFTYQCGEALERIMSADRRTSSRICLTENRGGVADPLPQIVFTGGDFHLPGEKTKDGLSSIGEAVETGHDDPLYVKTQKGKDSFPHSLFILGELKRPYDVLCRLDPATSSLPDSLGTEEEWQFALDAFQEHSSWSELISAKIGSPQNLDAAIAGYATHIGEAHWLWLCFIGMRLFGAGNNGVLQKAAEKASSAGDLVREIYRGILEMDPHDPAFPRIYAQRKDLLNVLKNPTAEVDSFCKAVLIKEKDAVYYLTDNTKQEKELLFKLLDKYGNDAYSREELQGILDTVYPDLGRYLSPYHFKDDLLDRYFQDYKYQKVINHILPEFLELVDEEAEKRSYNLRLPARSAKVGGISRENAQTYFVDAMGAEYLGYILAKCNALSMTAKVTVCRCNLPSITVLNKDFWDTFNSEERPIVPISGLDDIKHHGAEEFDYSKPDGKLPTHLIRELEILGNVLEQIQGRLKNGDYERAILIADHGASRLAVIHEHENHIEMQEKGVHSGRCCPKNDVDTQPEGAADAGEFWALANYDRFKGSRKASVEVHGGAALEEVTVPIVELTLTGDAVEIQLLPAEGSSTPAGVLEIAVSYRRKAAIRIFASRKLEDVTVEIDGHTYDAEPVDENFYMVEMPEIKKAKKYAVNVYAGGNLVAEELPLIVKKEGASETDFMKGNDR